MQIIINETSERKSLDMIDSKSGVNWVKDYIGNHGALSDGQFAWDDDEQAYRCDAGTYAWWCKVIDDNQALDDRIEELRAEYGSDRIESAIARAATGDLEHDAAAISEALDDEFSAAAQ